MRSASASVARRSGAKAVSSARIDSSVARHSAQDAVGLDADPLVGGEFAVGQGVQTGFEVGAGHFSTARVIRSRSIARALVSLALIAAGVTPSRRLISS